MFAIGLLVWWIFVYPVNVELAKWVNGPVPDDWADWRALWEWGQAANGLAQLAGFAALIASVLVTKEKKLKKAKIKTWLRPSAACAARCHGPVANPFQSPPVRGRPWLVFEAPLQLRFSRVLRANSSPYRLPPTRTLDAPSAP